MLCKFTICLILVTYSIETAASKQPEWIWARAESEDPGFVFQKSFSVESEVTAARFRCVGESTSVSVKLGGSAVCQIEAYDPLVDIDITEKLRRGNQTITVACDGVEGPSAFFALLELTMRDGSKKSMSTDQTWKCSSKDNDRQVKSFGEVDSRLTIPVDRGIGLEAVDNYQQWKQALSSSQGTDPASFVTTPGFEIQLVRSAKDDEDSWVSLAVDPKGRLVIAKEKVGILRMQLSEDGSQVTSVETIDRTLKECRGFAFIGETLFANANNSKALYRLKPDGEDGFGKPEVVYESSGGVGHGRNDITVGPDGMLYSIHGDSVDLPPRVADRTSPFRNAAFGEPRKEGHLLRIDPDTGKVTIVAVGLRNPFGIDFNPQGDVFTYDADAEYDMGSPWYRPTRVNHLVVGGDYGWRAVTKSWPSYYPDHPDNALPSFDVGKGSPTAVKFGTRSSFPKRYRDALFILDWTYGRIIAVHAVARGASYLMSAETFLQGRPLNVTDLDFAPDGSMYFVTGGRKTRSALYRVRYVGEPGDVASQTAQKQRRAKFAAESRRLRRSLEKRIVSNEAMSVDRVVSCLASDDPWIRHAARNVLERQANSQWVQASLTHRSMQMVLSASLSIARRLRFDPNDNLRQQVLASLNRMDLGKLSRSQKQTALYAYNLLIPDCDDSEPCKTAANQVASIFPDGSYVVNRAASELLVRWKHPEAVPKTMRLLNTAKEPVQQMQFLYVLRNVKQGWTPQLREQYFSALSMTREYVGGEGMNSFLTKIREEAVATLSDHETRSLGELTKDPRRALRQTKVSSDRPRAFVRQWTVNEVLAGSGSGKGDPKIGKQIFVHAKCVNCHRFKGQGTWVGPDLTSIARRFNRHDILGSIIRPSEVISEKYQSLQVVTKDGQSYVGQVAMGIDYRDPVLRLATDPANPLETIEISKERIALQKRSDVSWMPKGLLDTFSRDDILNLLAYLQN